MRAAGVRRGSSRSRAGCVFATLLACALVAFLAGCDSHVPPSESTVRQTEDIVRPYYPDWALESSHGWTTPGLSGGQQLDLVLRWRGSQDFRMVLGFWDPSPDRVRQQLQYPEVFMNRAQSEGFIRAFLARHSGSGWLVRMWEPQSRLDASGDLVDIEYRRMTDPQWQSERWNASVAATGTPLAWVYVSPLKTYFPQRDW